MANEDISLHHQKEIYILLCKIAESRLGVQLLSEYQSFLENLLNKFEQKKMFSLTGYVFSFANAFVSSKKGREIMSSKKFDWNVKLISKKRANQSQDNYIVIHK